MSIVASDWLQLIESEYFGTFIGSGGSCVKVLVCDEDVKRVCRTHVEALAKRETVNPVFVNSGETRIHMIHDLFFQIARASDLGDLARRAAQRIVAELGYRWPEHGAPTSFEDLGRSNGIDASLIKREVQKALTRSIMNNRQLAQDFRAAIMRLIYTSFETREQDRRDEQELLLGWMRGTLRGRTGLGTLGIAGPIGRHNARAMMRSLLHWQHEFLGRGTVLWIDLGALGVQGSGLRYTPSAALDMFEVLRQMIDGIDSFPGLLCFVVAPPSFLDESDHKYSIHAYLALKARLWSDVRPKGRDNPLAPLVKLVAS